MNRMLFLLITGSTTLLLVRALGVDEMPNKDEVATEFPDVKFVVGAKVFTDNDVLPKVYSLEGEDDLWVREVSERIYRLESVPFMAMAN